MIKVEDSVEKLVTALEDITDGTGSHPLSNVRTALFPTIQKTVFEQNLAGTSGTGEVVEPLPHTLASFVWYFPTATKTPITQPYTFPVLRPIASGCLIEAFVEVGTAAVGGVTHFEFFKNGQTIAELDLPAGTKTKAVPIGGTLENREFTRDDYVAFKISEATTQKAKFLTVYLRFYQYPYVMGDAQSPLLLP